MDSSVQREVKLFYNWLLTSFEDGCCSTIEVAPFHVIHRSAGWKIKQQGLRQLVKNNNQLFKYYYHQGISHIAAIPRVEGEFKTEWSTLPSIPEDVVSQVESMTVIVAKEYRGDFLEHVLIREKRKATSAENMAKLVSDEARRMELLNSDKTIETISNELNIAIGDAAIGLLGWQTIDSLAKVLDLNQCSSI
jgi:hypothetical protein